MSKQPSEDDYEKLKFKGGGTFGQVYKARRKDDPKQVCALKYISKRKSAKETRNDSNEIQLLQQLKHPNIVQLLASFETEENIVLVCEYASTELFKAIKGEWFGKFSEDKARRISCQICSALYFLHSRRVLHRDLKPQNILVTKDKNIKLCDFGFARFMGETYFARTILGTPLYMAPELFRGERYVHYTEKVDLWALGCIIYELRKGKPAFDARSFRGILLKHDDLHLPKKFSDNLKDLLSKLLAYDQHHRIAWPQILTHKWFKGGIVDSDLAQDSPYTRPDIANQKRIESIRVRMIRRFIKRVEHRDFAFGGKEAEKGGKGAEGTGDALGVVGDGDEETTSVDDALGVVGDGGADTDGEDIDTVIISMYEDGDEDEDEADDDMQDDENEDDSEDEAEVLDEEDDNQSCNLTQD